MPARSDRVPFPGLVPLILVLVLLVAAMPASVAQTAIPTGPDPSNGIPVGSAILFPSLQLNWQATDNLFRDAQGLRLQGARGPVSSSLVQVQPRLDFLLPYSNSRLTLSYSPQYRNYSRVDLPTKTAHSGRLSNMLVLSNGMEFDFDGEFSLGVLETTQIDPAEQLRFATTRFRRSRAGVNWTWNHPSHWGSVLVVERENVVFLKSLHDSNLLFNNYTLSHVALDATLELRPQLVFFGGMGRQLSRLPGEDRNGNGILDIGEDEDRDGTLDGGRSLREDSIRVGARGPFGRRVSGEMQAAYDILRPPESEGPSFRGLTVRASLLTLLTEASQMTFELERRPLQTLVGRSDVFVLNTARLAWSFAPNPVHSWTVSGRYQLGDYSDYSDNTLTVDGAWSIQVRRRAWLRLSALHTDRHSSIAAFSYAENRASLGWLFGWL